MRLKPETDGVGHDDLNITAHDHHPQPEMVDIDNTSQSLPPGTTYNLDITLSHSNYQVAKMILMGAKSPQGPQWKECAEVYATRDLSEAIAESVREVAFKTVYAMTYSKQNGDAYLTHKIFDNDVANEYILLQDAYITGSTLRLVFLNTFGGSATLWVKGTAHLF